MATDNSEIQDQSKQAKVKPSYNASNMGGDNIMHRLRSLQTLTIREYGKDGMTFSAYASAPVTFSFKNKSKESIGGFGNIMSALMQLSGTAPVLDFQRKFLYQGLEPVSLTFQCYLVLDDWSALTSYKDIYAAFDGEVRQPILSLLYYMLPTRKSNLVEDGGIADSIFQTIKSGYNWIIDAISSWVDLSAIRMDDNKTLSDYMGDVYLLNLPSQYELDGNNYLVAKWGKFTWKELVIESVDMTIPQLVYASGIPQYVQITIQLSTLRFPVYTGSGVSVFSM